MAVVVSKKIAKSAVVRNRIRRRLYEAVRTQKTLENHAVDTVFVVSDAKVAEIAASELSLQVAKVCGIITDHR